MLSFNVPTFVFVIINLLVLYFILKKLLFRPVTKFMEDRKNSIKEALEGAKKDTAEAIELKERYEELLKTARMEANKIVNHSRNIADREYNSIIKAARKEADNILEKANEEIRLQKQNIVEGIRHQVSDMSISIAAKLLEVNMDTESNRVLVNKFINEEGAA